MTPIEQAIEALEYSKSNASGCTCHSAYRTRQMTDPSCAACEYSEVMQGVDRALAALRSMEGREPVVLSDEDVDRAACSWAYTETGKPQDSDRSDWDQETKDWWHTEYGRALSLLQYVRDHGYLAPSPSEPRLTVEEAMELMYVDDIAKWLTERGIWLSAGSRTATIENAPHVIREYVRDRLTKAAKP